MKSRAVADQWKQAVVTCALTAQRSWEPYALISSMQLPFSSRVSTDMLTRDINIAVLSVCLSVCHVAYRCCIETA